MLYINFFEIIYGPFFLLFKNLVRRFNRSKRPRFNPNFAVPLVIGLNLVIARKFWHLDYLGRPWNFTIEGYFFYFQIAKNRLKQLKSIIRGPFLANVDMQNLMKQSVFCDRKLWKIPKTNPANPQ